MKKINTLLIDNGSDTLLEYIELLDMCNISILHWKDITENCFNGFELIILSDGNQISVNKNTKELTLINSCTIPIIGICYGFQILCFNYGMKISLLSQRNNGNNFITVLTEHPMFSGQRNFNSMEKHKYGVEILKNDKNDNIIYHASSLYGLEIMEVKEKFQYGFQFHPEIEYSRNMGGIILKKLISWLFNL